MPDIDWNMILDNEDRIIRNSNRKHRNHFKSLDTMSEEFAFHQGMDRYRQSEFEIDKDNLDVTENFQNEKLAEAMLTLTNRQRQVIKWYYWGGYKQSEIAAILSCGQNAVSMLLNRAVKRLQQNLSEK